MQKKRRSIRLSEYDYSQNGAYFITICTHEKKHLFGKIDNGEMVLNGLGKMVERCWVDIPYHFPSIVLDEFVVMPNHVHGILFIENSFYINDSGRGLPWQTPTKWNGLQKQSLGSIVNQYKGSLKRWANANNYSYFSWQRNYYEHIIRFDESLHTIREYILNNPIAWEQDEYFF